MAMIPIAVGEGPEAWHFSVSDLYGDPAGERRMMQAAWEQMQSLKWCPESKPRGWWWRKFFWKPVAERREEM